MSVFSEFVKIGDEVKNGIELAATDTEKAVAWLLKNKTIITRTGWFGRTCGGNHYHERPESL